MAAVSSFTKKIFRKLFFAAGGELNSDSTLNVNVGGNLEENIATDRNETIVAVKTSLIGSDKNESVGGNKLAAVTGNQSESVGLTKTLVVLSGDYNRNISDDSSEIVGINKSTLVTGNFTETIGGKKTIAAPAMKFSALGNFATDAAAGAGGVAIGELYFLTGAFPVGGTLRKRIV